MRFVKYTGTVVQIDDYGRNFSTGTYYLLNCTDCKFYREWKLIENIRPLLTESSEHFETNQINRDH
jgi:hypothetical protein